MNKLKRTLAFLSSVLFLFSASSPNNLQYPLKPFTAFAETDEHGEYVVCGNDKYYYIEDGDYAIITDYRGNGGFIELPETINGKPVIATWDIYGEDGKNIISVTLPDSIEYIDGIDAMQICGSQQGHAKEIAREHGIYFNEISGAPPYIKYREIDDHMECEIDFDNCGECIVPAQTGGKVVTLCYGENNFDAGFKTITFENSQVDLSNLEIEGNVMICGYPGSTAQIYANEHHLKFKPLDIEENEWHFTLHDTYAEAELMDYNIEKQLFTIPETWQGLPVTKMSNYFGNDVEMIVIPETVTGFIYDYDYEHPTINAGENLKYIGGVKGSFAEQIANEMGLKFIDMNCPEFRTEDRTDYDDSKYKAICGDIALSYPMPRAISGYDVNDTVYTYPFTDIVFPESVDGVPVKEIQCWLSGDWDALKSITIPDSVEYINFDRLPDDIVIYGGEGSAAQKFAEERNYKFRFTGLPDEAYYFYDNNKLNGYILYNSKYWTPDMKIPTQYLGWKNIIGLYFENSIESPYELTIPSQIQNIQFYNDRNPYLIRGYKGSAAEEYAKENYIPFVALDSEIPEGMKYVLYNDHVEITSVDECLYWNSYVEIPEYIDGRPVTHIGSGIIKKKYDDKYLYIPETVTHISDDAVMGENERYNLNIDGVSGSAAEEFAQKHNFDFTAKEPKEKPQFEYSENYSEDDEDKTICISGYKDFYWEDRYHIDYCIIPEKIGGKTVTRLYDVYRFCDPLVPYTITIPSTVTEIENPYFNSDSQYQKSDFDLTIICDRGSYAHQYAIENDIPYKFTDEIGYQTTYYDRDNHCIDRFAVSATVPEYLNGRKIESTENMFWDCERLRSVTFLGFDTKPTGLDYLEEIRGYSESRAHAYALQHNIKFVSIDSSDKLSIKRENDGNYIQNCDISAVDISISNDVAGIEYDAFEGCTALRSITIPDTVNDIPDSVFSDCINLEIIYGKRGSAAEEYARAHNINFIAENSGARYIAFDSAYDGWCVTGYDSDASEAIIPEMIMGEPVTEIDNNAFYGCQKIKSIAVPESVKSVGSFNNSGIETVIFPENWNGTIHNFTGSIAFLNPDTDFSEMEFGNNQRIFGYYGSTAQKYAKENNNPFITIIDEKDIPSDIFEYEIYNAVHADEISALDRYTLDQMEDSYVEITKINSDASTIEIPETIYGIPVKYVVTNAFESCPNVKELHVNGRDTYFIEHYFNSYNIDTLKAVYGYLKNSSGEKSGALELAQYYRTQFIELDSQEKYAEGIEYYPDDYEKISTANAYDLADKTLTFPDSMYGYPVKYVDVHDCEALEEIVLPENVKGVSIYNCPSLKKITSSNPDLEININSDDIRLEEIHAPANEKNLAVAASCGAVLYDINSENVYSYPQGLKCEFMGSEINITGWADGINENLVIPEKIYGFDVTHIYKDAFADCDILKSVEIPKSVEYIEDAFADCSSLESITILNPEIQIYSAWQFCSENVIIKSQIGDNAWRYAFEKCNPFYDIKSDTFYPAPKGLGYYMDIDNNGAVIQNFDDSISGELEIPENIYGLDVKAVELWGISYNENIESITIPSTVEELHGPVTNCPSLKIITVNNPECILNSFYGDELFENTIIQSEPDSTARMWAAENKHVFWDMSGNIYEAPEGIEYYIEDGYPKITAITQPVAVIPESIYGMPISEILSLDNFTEYSEDMELTIPASINKIGDEALTNLHNLRKLTILNPDTIIGENLNFAEPEDLTIWGYSGSTAETFANENGYRFVDIEVGEIPEPEPEKIDLFDAHLSVGTLTFAYDGKSHTVPSEVILGDTVLREGIDYEISGNTASDVGTYVLTVTGTGRYKGSIGAVWRIADTFEVTTDINGTKNKLTYEAKTSATVEAPDVEGMKFSHWEANGSKVSTSQKYSFIVLKNVNLTAVYVDESEIVIEEPLLILETSQTILDNKNAIYYTFTHSIPYEYKIKQVGLLYGTNKTIGADTSVSGYALVDLTQPNELGITDVESVLKNNGTGNITEFIAPYQKNEGTVLYSCIVNGNTEAYVYAIGYIFAVDADGSERKFYSRLAAVTFINANNN